jgi:hypothetical protein
VDVKTFVDQTLRGLAAIQQVVDTAVTAEGPIVDGYAFVSDSLYLHFYFNATTGTIAFALIQEKQRIWGIDYDNRRNWHLHPLGTAQRHQPISAQSIGDIIHLFGVVPNELDNIY